MSQVPDVFDQEANRFARFLLVPTKILKSHIRKNRIKNFGDKELKQLAKDFQVEQSVMMTRLMEEKLIQL